MNDCEAMRAWRDGLISDIECLCIVNNWSIEVINAMNKREKDEADKRVAADTLSYPEQYLGSNSHP